MYLLSMIFFIFFLITVLIMKISLIISLKLKMNYEKMSPFECGFNPLFYKRISFSLRFFLISIIFLIFDIEIALLMPMIYSFKISNLKLWLLTSMMFIIILLVGLFHEWNYGALNWI